MNKSRLGRGVRAVAQDPDTASLMGVNQERVIMLVFVLGGAMAGVAALLFTIQYDSTKFDVGFIIGLKAFTAAVLGGIGNLRGALVGGLILGIVAPVFLIIALGYSAAKRGLVDKAGFTGLNTFAFALASPALLFPGSASGASAARRRGWGRRARRRRPPPRRP